MQIRKCKKIIGHRLELRNANLNDADFILSLRTNESKNKYLSPTSSSLSAQKDWLRSYEQNSGQAYFVIFHNDSPVGTVRLYDQSGDSFCWGSWLISNSAPSFAGIESALIVYSYANVLGFKKSHFDVRKDNASVWRFHERFGAIRSGETELDFLYSIFEDDILQSINRYRKFLPDSIEIVW